MRKVVLNVPLSLVAMSVLAASSNLALAADDDSTQVLDPIVVNATAVAEESVAAANEDSSVTEINADSIENSLIKNLEDLFRYEPGVDVTNEDRFGTKGVNIRGLDGSRVAMEVDGVKLADPYGPTSTYLRTGQNTVDMDSLEAVSVIKGGDVVDGSGLAGTVKYKTKEPSSFLEEEGDDTYVSVKAGYKSVSNEMSETVTAANRTGNLESLLVYTHRDGNETENYLGDASGDTTVGSDRDHVNPADKGSDNILAKVQYQLNDDNRIGAVVENYDSNVTSTLYSDSSSSSDYSSNDDVTRTHVGVFHENTQATSAYDRLKWQLDYQDTKTVMRTMIDSSSTNRVVNRFYDEEAISLKGDFIKDIDAHHIKYGANYTNKSLETLAKDTRTSTSSGEVTSNTVSRFSPLADADIFGVYAEDSWALTDSFTLKPSVRYDSYNYSTSSDEYVTDSYADSTNDAFTAQIGFNYDLTNTYALFGKFGTGFRAPTLDELYFYYDGGRGYSIQPNPDLESETSKFTEAGLRITGDNGEAEFTAFYNDYDNFIETSQYVSGSFATGDYVATSVNIDRVIIQGLEFKGSLDLASFSKGLKLHGGIAYAKGENLEDDEPLDSIAPLSAAVALAYDAPTESWGGAVNLTLASKKDTSDITESQQDFATAGYTLVDLTGYYKPTDMITINAGIFNVTDEEYWVWSDVRDLSSSDNMNRYSQAGRNFGVDVTVAF